MDASHALGDRRRAGTVAVHATWPGRVRQAAGALRDALRRLAAAHRRRRLGRSTVRALQALDTQTLRDLGVGGRSEIPSAVGAWLAEPDPAQARVRPHP